MKTKDFFVPKYQNIIDPNLNVTGTNNLAKWCATDFIIKEINSEILNQIIALQLCILSKKQKKLSKRIISLVLAFIPTKTKRGVCHISSQINDIKFDGNEEFYLAVENLFNAVLPLLNKLRKPALLFPGKLQAVIKAQRIYLQPGEDYSGCWHTDGKNEDIFYI